MKTKKKKVAFPRRTWQINPVTRVKDSAKRYLRPRVKRELKQHDRQERTAARPADRPVLRSSTAEGGQASPAMEDLR